MQGREAFIYPCIAQNAALILQKHKNFSTTDAIKVMDWLELPGVANAG